MNGGISLERNIIDIMQEQVFRIGDLTFKLSYPEAVTIPGNFLKFRCTTSKPDCTYHISLTETFPDPQGRLAAQRHDLVVYQHDGLETRYQGMYGGEWNPYVCIRQESSEHTDIFLHPSILEDLVYDTVFTSLFSLERKMIAQDAMILHSAYLFYQGQAILFSAPSGTGKSTQAGLWEKYRGGHQVNGDRSLLQKVGGRWYARGWPVCGSSEICHNTDTPIRAIVMLSQDQTNTIRKLSPMKAFSELYSQITINRWDREFQNHAMDLIEQVIREVPVYHLACTISEEAVRCLEKELFK